MRERNSYEDCIREFAAIQKEKPAKGFANANRQIQKLSRRLMRLLDLLHFHQEMQAIDWRLVEQHIRDTSKRVRLLIDKARSNA